jgi:hypothetical protein
MQQHGGKASHDACSFSKTETIILGEPSQLPLIFGESTGVDHAGTTIKQRLLYSIDGLSS